MRLRFSALVGTGLLAFLVSTMQAFAGPASEAAFYREVAGRWTGPGEIVAGKYKGTRFNCTFEGIAPDTKSGIKIDGSCRVGVFSQPMNASFVRSGGRYTGQFLDGESGEGMDVVGGRYSHSKLVVNIKRNDLRGVMVTRLADDGKLNITISVNVDNRLVPVIGMSLDRQASYEQMIASSTTD